MPLYFAKQSDPKNIKVYLFLRQTLWLSWKNIILSEEGNAASRTMASQLHSDAVRILCVQGIKRYILCFVGASGKHCHPWCLYTWLLQPSPYVEERLVPN